MKWFESDIDVVEIDGNLYALNGWNGEKWAHCWRCIDFQDADGNAINGVIGYEVTA